MRAGPSPGERLLPVRDPRRGDRGGMVRPHLRRPDFSRPFASAQAILYLFAFVAAGHVIATSGNPGIGFAAVGFGVVIAVAWNVLMLSSPLLVAAAWALMRAGGRKRVWGIWLRAGGDVGMLAGLATFVVTRIIIVNTINPPPTDAALFSWIIITGMAVVVFTLVIRDVVAIIVMERVASHIHATDDDDGR